MLFAHRLYRHFSKAESYDKIWYARGMKKIPSCELQFTANRSGGPGGQHANKVDTKVELRWHFLTSSVLSESEKDQIVNSNEFRNKITKSGEIILFCEEYRSQRANKEAVLAKLQSMLSAALYKARPRKSTTLPPARKRARQREKIAQSKKKDLRKKPNSES